MVIIYTTGKQVGARSPRLLFLVFDLLMRYIPLMSVSEYHLSFNRRLIVETLCKYANTFASLCELINNAIQAEASQIDITIDYEPASSMSPMPFHTITVRDNGLGIARSEFKRKILEVATDVKPDGQGVGRFAALQIGKVVRIETVAYDELDNTFTRSKVQLSEDLFHGSGDLAEQKVSVDHETLKGKHETYYQITVSSLYTKDECMEKNRRRRLTKAFLEENIFESLFGEYAEAAFNKTVRFSVNGKPLNPSSFVAEPPTKKQETFKYKDEDVAKINYTFIKLKREGAQHRAFIRTDNAGLKSVAHTYTYSVDIPEHNQWFIYADSTFFDHNQDLFRNLTVMAELTDHGKAVLEAIKAHMDEFFARKYEGYKAFVEELSRDTSYPYVKKAASSEARTMLFHQMAYYVEEQHSILRQRQSIRELVYDLLDRSLDSGDIGNIISEVLKLTPPLIAKFKELLAKVELAEVIEYSEQVAKKVQFLDFLHNILYGQPSKLLKERSQLHKIVEKHLWLFGDEYNNTPALWSDKSLGNALDTLREQHLTFTTSSEDDNTLELKEEALRDVIDLFFYSKRVINDELREVLIVELKAPIVRLSNKEITQVRRYAFDIESKGIFPQNVTYKIILIGSEITQFGKSQVGKADPLKPTLLERSKTGRIEIYVMPWSDLIEVNRRKLSVLGQELKVQDKAVKEVFAEDFKDIDLQKLRSVLNETPS